MSAFVARPRRPLPVLVLSVLVLAACGESGADAGVGQGAALEASAAPVAGSDRSAPGDAPVLGTVEGTLGGEARRWYVVSGEAMDGPYASGLWMGEEADGYTIVVGGLDSEDPPIETFTRSGPSGLSTGEYVGSAMTLMFPVPEGGTGRYEVNEAASGTNVAYTADASVMELDQIFMMVDGVIEIEAAAVEDGRGRARGTFSGTLRRMPEGETLEVSAGRFDVEALPNVDAIQPGG